MIAIRMSRARDFLPFLFLLFTLIAGPALAVQPVVKTVPWVPTNPLIPHDAISGQATTLKGTANVQGANFEATWDFGDGSPVATATVTNQYVISAVHTYVGSIGDVFTAVLTVRDTTTGESDSANYFVMIQALNPGDNLAADVNIAIDRGLWYLHQTMSRTTSISGLPSGRWTSGFAASSYQSNWASNLQAFEVNGHLPSGDPSNPYTETAERALRSVLDSLRTIGIPASMTNPQGTFNPDTNGNGLGIELTQSQDQYQGGMMMDAIIAAGTPAALADTGPAGIINRSHADIIADMADYYVRCQYVGTQGGGWRYGCGSFPDGSANQWAAIGLVAAERAFGYVTPTAAKAHNVTWISYAQGIDGRSGYTGASSAPWGVWATTPSGTVQMAWNGIGRGDALWDLSETFLRDNFCNIGGATAAIRDYYYGMFSFTKSMLLHDSNGDGVAEPITMLQSATPGVAPIDWYAAQASSGDQCDGVARTLINDQAAAGYWRVHNVSGSQYSFETSWAIIMLNQTVFASDVPVAVAAANPNPAVAGQTITLDGSGSFHQDSSLNIVSWSWDLDNDGTDDATGVVTTTSFAAVGSYPVRLTVCDDETPVVCDDTILTVIVDTPPVAPTADGNGPYVFCPATQPWFLDGTGSVNPDDGQSEPGLPGDSIQSYEWDLSGNNVCDNAAGAQPDVTAFFTAAGIGDYLIRLRVTDTTAVSFPSSGMGDLSDTATAQVSVKPANDAACQCIDDLTARAKSGKIQLVWSDSAPEGGYNVYRSTTQGGPYAFIANTTSSYSTYLDRGLTNGVTYYYIVRPAALNGDELCQSNEVSGKPSARTRRGRR